MNWIIVPCRNNIHLTRKAVKTFRAQDVGNVNILVIDNASSDGTPNWLGTQRDLMTIRHDPPMSVAASWNHALKYVFYQHDAKYALVVNNDTELRPDTYRQLLAHGGGFVTAVGTSDPEKIQPDIRPSHIQDGSIEMQEWNTAHLYVDGDKMRWSDYPRPNPEFERPHPDFSCFLIRREVYEKVGPFDEAFKIAFCEDSDFDTRMYKAGIRAVSIDLPFLHHGSQTIKNADPVEARRIGVQADRNREYFRRKWGYDVGSSEYYNALNKGGPE